MARRGEQRSLSSLSDDELTAARIDAEAVVAQAMSDDNRRLHNSARRDLIAIAEEEKRRAKAGRPEMEW
jgi:hypothetical protein